MPTPETNESETDEARSRVPPSTHASLGARKRRFALLAVMWLGAVAAMVAIYIGRAPGETPPARRAPGAPTLAGEEDHLPPRPAAAVLASLPAGPPRQYRGDRRHTGRSSHVGPASAELAWTFETGGRVTAQPVVDEEGHIYVASHDGQLYALNPFGTERWRASLGGIAYSTPLVDTEGRVFVGSDAAVFHCFDAEGNLVWRLQTEGDADTGASLTPDGDIVFAAGKDLWRVGVEGTVRWRFRAHGKIYTSPAVEDDGTVYVGSQDDHLYAVAANGRERWSYRAGADIDSSPVLGDDGTIFFGSDDHHVYALDRNGGLRWSADLDGMVRAPVALSLDGAVLAGVYGPRPRVVSLDAATGALRWFFPVTVSDTTEIGVASGPLVDREGQIYFGAHDDYLYALAPTGALRWVYAAGADVDTSPVLTSSGLLLIGSDDHRLHALSARDVNR